MVKFWINTALELEDIDDGICLPVVDSFLSRHVSCREIKYTSIIYYILYFYMKSIILYYYIFLYFYFSIFLLLNKLALALFILGLRACTCGVLQLE